MSVFHEFDAPSVGEALDGQEYITSMSDIEASICPPPCECIDCQHPFYAAQEQYQPRFFYYGRVFNLDAQRIAKAHVQDAKQGGAYLLQRLASHADTIINSWEKKCREKRQVLLVDSVLDLSERRWFLPRYTFPDESEQISCRT